MSKTSKFTIGSAAALAVILAFGPANATDREILGTTVLSSLQATTVDLGSKRALGYFGKRNGKCDLTVMVVENDLKRASVEASAARIRFAIVPGRTARVESTQGKSVEFHCGFGARRMFVTTIGHKADNPRS